MQQPALVLASHVVVVIFFCKKRQLHVMRAVFCRYYVHGLHSYLFVVSKHVDRDHVVDVVELPYVTHLQRKFEIATFELSSKGCLLLFLRHLVEDAKPTTNEVLVVEALHVDESMFAYQLFGRPDE